MGDAVRVTLISGASQPPAVEYFDRIGARVAERSGAEVDVVHATDDDPERLVGADLVVSHVALPAGLERRVRCIGGRRLTRPEGLERLAHAGVEVMEWTSPRHRDDVHRLFGRWRSDRLLLKLSGSHAGAGTYVFDSSAVPSMRWRPGLDIVCREVNPTSGDVTKVELFGGEEIVTWRSQAPTIAEQYTGGVLHGVAGAYGDRSLCELGDEVLDPIRAFGRASPELGYVSVDLMERADGRLVAIELNANDVAVWWTSRLAFVGRRYADAIARAIG